LKFPSVNVGIKGSALLQMNTSNSESYAQVAAGKTFALEFGESISDDIQSVDGSANIKIYNFKLAEFKGGMTLKDNKFTIKIDQAKLNFFNQVTINISGHFSSVDDFRIRGEGDLEFNLGEVLKLKASVDLDFSNASAKAELSGEISASIPLNLPEKPVGEILFEIDHLNNYFYLNNEIFIFLKTNNKNTNYLVRELIKKWLNEGFVFENFYPNYFSTPKYINSTNQYMFKIIENEI